MSNIDFSEFSFDQNFYQKLINGKVSKEDITYKIKILNLLIDSINDIESKIVENLYLKIEFLENYYSKVLLSKKEKKLILSGYINFCEKIRQQVKNENPNISFGNIAKISRQMWDELSTEEKNSFEPQEYLNFCSIYRAYVVDEKDLKKIWDKLNNEEKSRY
jgi:hypothetical protein